MASLLFVGSTPMFKREFEGKIHYTAAIICFIAIILWMSSEKLFLDLAIMSIIFVIMILFDKTKYVYFAEIIIWFYIISLLLNEHIKIYI